MFEADHFERLTGRGVLADLGGDENVPDGGEGGNEVVELEDEADASAAIFK